MDGVVRIITPIIALKILIISSFPSFSPANIKLTTAAEIGYVKNNTVAIDSGIRNTPTN